MSLPAVLTPEAQTGKPLCVGPDPSAELLTDFLGGLRPSTRKAYAKDFAVFGRWLHPPDGDGAAALAWLLGMDAGEANRTVLHWRDAQLEAGTATATIARRLAALRSAVKLARTLGRVSWGLEIRSPRVEARRDSRGPEAADFKKLWKAAVKLGDTLRGRRDRALVALLYDLALRRNEVCALERGDYDAAARTLAVIRKGKRERVRLTVPEPTARALDDWLFVRGAAAGPLMTAANLAALRAVRRLDGESVARAVKALGRAAGLSRPVRPHGLRHAAITRALEKGHDVRAVRKFSGHSRLDTVLLYDDSRDDTAGKIARQVAGDRR